MPNNELEKKILDMRIFRKVDKEHMKLWFTKKLVTHFSSPEPSPALEDLALESKVVSEIGRTVQAIRSRRELPNPLLSNLGNAKRIAKNGWRGEVIYGIIGNSPALLDDEPILNSLIERRLRILEKMRFSVNKKKNIFRYPSTGENDAVNPSASIYWTKQDADVFFLSTMSDNPGASDYGIDNPENALYTIFNPPTKKHLDRNRLSCNQVATIVLMDSLLAIEDADLFPTLSQVNKGYLRIGNPYGVITSERPVFFTIDEDDSRALFENSDVDFNDLQLSDHVYIYNHPVYNNLAPNGIWQGEHSFISKKIYKKDEIVYKYYGHGFSSGLNLAQIRRYMMKKLRKHFKKAQNKIGEFFISNEEEDGSPKASFSNGIKDRLSYGGKDLNNITRDTIRESELPFGCEFACWFIEYTTIDNAGNWVYEPFYFFDMDGSPIEITLENIPEMPFTTKSNMPFSGKCQVIRPKTE